MWAMLAAGNIQALVAIILPRPDAGVAPVGIPRGEAMHGAAAIVSTADQQTRYRIRDANPTFIIVEYDSGQRSALGPCGHGRACDRPAAIRCLYDFLMPRGEVSTPI